MWASRESRPSVTIESGLRAGRVGFQHRNRYRPTQRFTKFLDKDRKSHFNGAYARAVRPEAHNGNSYVPPSHRTRSNPFVGVDLVRVNHGAIREENGVVGNRGIEVVKSCIFFVCHYEINVDNIAHSAFAVIEEEVACLQGRTRPKSRGCGNACGSSRAIDE